MRRLATAYAAVGPSASRRMTAIVSASNCAAGGEDEIARHRDCEAAGRGDAVHRGDKRLRRAFDLGDGAVDVLEDLLEQFTVAIITAAACFGCEITQVGGVPASADILQIGAAAEDSAGATNYNGAHAVVARELKARLAQVLRRCDIERVEPLGAVDRDDANPVVALHFDVLHRCITRFAQQIRGKSSPSGSVRRRSPNPVSRITKPGRCATQFPTISACLPSGCERSAASTLAAASGRTPSTALPSFAACMGSIPSSSPVARTLGLTGIRDALSMIPTRLFPAISCSVLASPPRVGSFIATTPSPPASSARLIKPLRGATSEHSSPSSSSECRSAITASP